MFDWQLYVALVLALAIGFFLGYRYRRQKRNSPSFSTSIDDQYFKGLNFLLNEEPDAAIDTFIQALEVNSDTLETHLALGKLLRKRGEVDRAIRIHQNLLARPGLTFPQIQQAQYELATDFIKAGLLDRAEGLLEELVAKDGTYKVLGLKRLLEVYRDEKEWLQGLDVLQKLSGSRLSRSYDEWAPIRAHFCCELAEVSVSRSDHLVARQWLKQALGYEKQSVRAGLLLGELEIADGALEKGATQLRRVALQSVDCIPEVLPLLTSTYQQLNQFDEYFDFLSSLYRTTPNAGILLVLADIIARRDGELVAAEYIAQEIVKIPSGLGLHRLLEYYLSFSQGSTHRYLQSLQNVVNEVVVHGVSYQCRHCGFSGKQLHWLCPSCKRWGGGRLQG